MYRGGGLGQVVGGMVAVALGIALTLISYQLAPPGGTYFIFVGLIISGLLMIFRGLVTPGTTSGTLRDHNRPARSPVSGYVAPPEQMPPGYCWQCGRKVKPRHTICLSCGATQIHGAAPYRSGNSVSQNDWDLTASTPGSATRWESPPPPRNPAPAEQWHEPMRQPKRPMRQPVRQPRAPGTHDTWDTWDRPPNPPNPPARPRRPGRR
jgi:hypothetical protein